MFKLISLNLLFLFSVYDLAVGAESLIRKPDREFYAPIVPGEMSYYDARIGTDDGFVTVANGQMVFTDLRDLEKITSKQYAIGNRIPKYARTPNGFVLWNNSSLINVERYDNQAKLVSKHSFSTQNGFFDDLSMFFDDGIATWQPKQTSQSTSAISRFYYDGRPSEEFVFNDSSIYGVRGMLPNQIVFWKENGLEVRSADDLSLLKEIPKPPAQFMGGYSPAAAGHGQIFTYLSDSTIHLKILHYNTLLSEPKWTLLDIGDNYGARPSAIYINENVLWVVRSGSGSNGPENSIVMFEMNSEGSYIPKRCYEKNGNIYLWGDNIIDFKENTTLGMGYFSLLMPKNALPRVLVKVNVSNVNEIKGSAEITVSLDAEITTPVSFRLLAVDGSAISGSDFQALDEVVTMLPGQKSINRTIMIYQDYLDEYPEHFNILVEQCNGCVYERPDVVDEPKVTIHGELVRPSYGYGGGLNQYDTTIERSAVNVFDLNGVDFLKVTDLATGLTVSKLQMPPLLSFTYGKPNFEVDSFADIGENIAVFAVRDQYIDYYEWRRSDGVLLRAITKSVAPSSAYRIRVSYIGNSEWLVSVMTSALSSYISRQTCVVREDVELTDLTIPDVSLSEDHVEIKLIGGQWVYYVQKISYSDRAFIMVGTPRGMPSQPIEIARVNDFKNSYFFVCGTYLCIASYNQTIMFDPVAQRTLWRNSRGGTERPKVSVSGDSVSISGAVYHLHRGNLRKPYDTVITTAQYAEQFYYAGITTPSLSYAKACVIGGNKLRVFLQSDSLRLEPRTVQFLLPNQNRVILGSVQLPLDGNMHQFDLDVSNQNMILLMQNFTNDFYRAIAATIVENGVAQADFRVTYHDATPSISDNAYSAKFKDDIIHSHVSTDATFFRYNHYLFIGNPKAYHSLDDLRVTGRVDVYDLRNDSYVGQVVVNGVEEGDLFGASLFAHGDKLYVGAPGPSSFGTPKPRGVVYEIDINKWIVLRTFVNTTKCYNFGSKIYATDQYIAITAQGKMVSTGMKKKDFKAAVAVYPSNSLKPLKIVTKTLEAFGTNVVVHGNDLFVAASSTPASKISKTLYSGVGAIYKYSLPSMKATFVYRAPTFYARGYGNFMHADQDGVYDAPYYFMRPISGNPNQDLYPISLVTENHYLPTSHERSLNVLEKNRYLEFVPIATGVGFSFYNPVTKTNDHTSRMQLWINSAFQYEDDFYLFTYKGFYKVPLALAGGYWVWKRSSVTEQPGSTIDDLNANGINDIEEYITQTIASDGSTTNSVSVDQYSPGISYLTVNSEYVLPEDIRAYYEYSINGGVWNYGFEHELYPDPFQKAFSHTKKIFADADDVVTVRRVMMPMRADSLPE